MQTHSIECLDAIDDSVNDLVTEMTCVGLDEPSESWQEPTAQIRFTDELGEVAQFSLSRSLRRFECSQMPSGTLSYPLFSGRERSDGQSQRGP